MFDKLEDLVDRLDTLNNQLTDPDIVSDQNKFRKLMKEQSELTPIVEKYKEYRKSIENQIGHELSDAEFLIRLKEAHHDRLVFKAEKHNKISTVEKNVPKCPTCQSTDIKKVSTASKAGSVFMWGLLSQKVKKQWHCNNCGYEW